MRVHWQPSVSVVMATRRPDLLEHAVGQVARQRGVESWSWCSPRTAGTPTRPGSASWPARVGLQVVPPPDDVLFGDVLNHAAEAAGGDVVLKMDDDDWYSPDFVADLLLARAYSGAELVGTPDDFYYLEDRDLTVRLGQPSEVYRGFVAGGTMLLDAGPCCARSAASAACTGTSTRSCSTPCAAPARRRTAPTGSATACGGRRPATPGTPTSTTSSPGGADLAGLPARLD